MNSTNKPTSNHCHPKAKSDPKSNSTTRLKMLTVILVFTWRISLTIIIERRRVMKQVLAKQFPRAIIQFLKLGLGFLKYIQNKNKYSYN